MDIYTWVHQASRLDVLAGRRAYQASLREQYVYIYISNYIWLRIGPGIRAGTFT